jgi:hypothetical protein
VIDEIDGGVAAVPQFQDTPTSISRFVPVPVVCEKLRLDPLEAVPPEPIAPSRVTAPLEEEVE